METKIFILIASLGVITYLIRLLPFMVIRKNQIPKVMEDWITYIGEGIMVSLLIPYLLLSGKTFDISIGNPKILSGVLCAVVAFKTKSLTLAIISGVVCMIIYSHFLN